MADISSMLGDQALSGLGRNPLVQNQVPLGYQADGPAAATFVDQMDQNQQDAQMRMNRDSDLSYLDAFNTYGQNVKNNPLRDAMRQLGLSDTALKQSTYDSGQQRDVMESGLSAQHKENLLKMDTADLQSSMTKGAHYVQAAAMLDQLGPTPQSHQDHWDEFRAAANDMGIKNVPEKWSLESESRIRAQAAAAVNTVPHIQKILETRETGTQSQKTAQVAADASMYHTDAEVKIAFNAPTMDRETVRAFRAMNTDKDNEGFRAMREVAYIGKTMNQMTKANPAVEMASMTYFQAKADYLKDPTPKKKEAMDNAELVYNSLITENKGSAATKGTIPPAGAGGGQTSPPGAPPGGKFGTDGSYTAPDGSIWKKKGS